MSSSVRIAVLLVAVTAVAGSVTALPSDEPQLVSGAPGSGVGSEFTVDDPAATGTEGREAQVRSRIVGGESGDGPATAGGGSEGGPGQGSSGPAQGAQGSGGGNLECAPGKNGGSTDTGVSDNKIDLAATIVTSGPGSTFLGDSQFGMQAVVAKVNSQGGICGRQLNLTLRNDGWEAQRGHQFLKNFINEGVFALPVVPSSEGLRAAGPDVKGAGIPVVGSDGMLIEQYRNEWIWPVATATVSQMRIMAKYAYDKGARNFAIVFDDFYRFGVEGKDAYEKYVKSLSGAKFVHAEGVQPNQPGYGPQIQNLNNACGDDGCDVVAMLLDPGTANTWISGDEDYVRRADFRFGAQPLFTGKNFAQPCKARCDGMVVWTGYVPALGSNTRLPGVKEFVQDVKAVQPSADTSNQFLEGAYLGMSVFVDALEEVGPNLTRARLREVMNQMSYTSDLSSKLTWTSDRRKANIRAQAWRINAGSGSFDGFQDLETGWLADPKPNAE